MAVGFTKIDLGREYSAGVNMPAGSADALKLARANAAGTNLEYVAATSAVTADGTLATALAPFLASTNVVEDASNNLEHRPAPGVSVLSDDFISGPATSSLPWDLDGTGTPVRAVSFGGAKNPGVHILTTSAATNDSAWLDMGRLFVASVDLFRCIVQLQSTADVTAFFGLNRSAGVTLGTAGFRFLYDSSISANWLLEARDASTTTQVDSGVAADTNFVDLQITRAAGSLIYTINGATERTISTNVPDDGSNLHSYVIGCQTLTTAAKSVKVDWFSSTIRTGSRV